MRLHTYSEAGHQHRSNEDAFAAVRHGDIPDVLICAVADGQGGRAGGERAAKIAVSTSIATATREGVHDQHIWPLVLAAADEAVEEDLEAGYATLITCVVSECRVAGASVGDSAALLRSDGTLHVLTDNQRKNPAIGSGAAHATTFSADLVSPWKLLIITDGVYRYMSWDGISDCVQRLSGEELIQALLQAQKQSHGGLLGDDFTVVLVEG